MMIVIALSAIAVLAAFMAQPFVSQRRPSVRSPTGPLVLRSLREEKASALLSIRELDFDYETGKLSKEDYSHLRQKYEDQAVRLLRQLEEAEKAYEKAEKEIERELEKRIGKIAKPSAFCSHCGAPQSKKDKFCASCGKSVEKARA